MHHVVIVEFPWGRDKDPRTPLGHASLLAVLNQLGVPYSSHVHEVNAERFDVAKAIANILSDLREDSMLAVGAYVWAEDIVQFLLSRARNSGFRGPIVLGGPQISYTSGELESHYPEADFFVRGYGEMALASLALDASADIQGVHRAGAADRNEQTLVDLSQMPSPWLTGVIPLEDQKFIRWETQRGCPFKCGFCQHKEPGARLRVPHFNMERILNEVDLFCRSGVEDIAVLDPIFNASSHCIEVLKRFVNNGFTGRLSLQCRAEMLTDEFLNLASQLQVRLEFGLQTIHADEGQAVDRRNNIPKARAKFEQVNKRGLPYEVSIIYGLPEQTLASFLETVAWCIELQVPVLKAFPLMLLRGTSVEERKEEWGLVESEGSMPVVVQSDSFSFEDWVDMTRISEALKQTEHAHPQSIEELREIANQLDPDVNRFMPTPPSSLKERVVFRSSSAVEPVQYRLSDAHATALAVDCGFTW